MSASATQGGHDNWKVFQVRCPSHDPTNSVKGPKRTLQVTGKLNIKFQKYKPSTSIFGGLALVSPEGASNFVNKLRS